jgi:hypothetical protein
MSPHRTRGTSIMTSRIALGRTLVWAASKSARVMHGAFGFGVGAEFGGSKSSGGVEFTVFEIGRYGEFGWLAIVDGLGRFGAFAGFGGLARFGGICVLRGFEVLGGLGNSARSEGFDRAKLEGEVETGRSSSGSLRVA